MLVLMSFSVFFWALFEQAASSVTLFTDRNVNTVGELPAGMFQALNPFFIVLFAPVFAYLWAYLGKKNILTRKKGIMLLVLYLIFIIPLLI